MTQLVGHNNKPNKQKLKKLIFGHISLWEPKLLENRRGQVEKKSVKVDNTRIQLTFENIGKNIIFNKS